MMDTLHASPWSDLSSAPDPARMTAALGSGLAHCADGSWVIEGLRISKVRRSSSLRRDPHPISMCLDVELHDPEHLATTRQRYFAKAYRGGASEAALQAIDAARLAQPAAGPAVARLAELDMLVWCWPNDPALPQLARLTDPVRAGALLPASLAGATVSRVEVLHYEPERRATLRCTLAPQRPGEPVRSVYAKTFADPLAARLAQRFKCVQAAAQADPAAACVAESLGVDAHASTFWQWPAPGRPLLDDLAHPAPDAAFEAIGAALARLHALDLGEPAVRSTSFWLTEMQRRIRKVSRAAPHLAAQVASIGAALESAARRLTPPALGSIHGDFHPGQVWLSEGRVVFFDFDEFALGNPMEDLAEFIVKLEQVAQPAGRFERQVLALIGGYRHAAPQRFNADWLQWHRTLQTLLQASRAFVYQEPGWSTLIDERVRACERLAGAIRTEVPA